MDKKVYFQRFAGIKVNTQIHTPLGVLLKVPSYT